VAYESQPPNGPELTGADPHAVKYSAREVATSGAASGAAWSWAALPAANTPRRHICALRRPWKIPERFGASGKPFRRPMKAHRQAAETCRPREMYSVAFDDPVRGLVNPRSSAICGPNQELTLLKTACALRARQFDRTRRRPKHSVSADRPGWKPRAQGEVVAPSHRRDRHRLGDRRSQIAPAATRYDKRRHDDPMSTHLVQPPNGPELTGADPHAQKYSAREAAKGGPRPVQRGVGRPAPKTEPCVGATRYVRTASPKIVAGAISASAGTAT